MTEPQRQEYSQTNATQTNRSAPIKPVTKTMNWTLSLKVDGDLIKIPEVKITDTVDVTAPLEFEASVAGAGAKYVAFESTVDLPLPEPETNRIVALVLRLDPKSPKEMKPLRVSLKSQDKDLNTKGVQADPDVSFRELGMDASKSALVYFASLEEMIPKLLAPPQLEVHSGSSGMIRRLYIANENQFDVTVLLSLAYGAKPLP
jgi:hypothetical protein